MVDPPAIAGGTDRVQARSQTFEASRNTKKATSYGVNDDILLSYLSRRAGWRSTLASGSG